MPSTSSAILIPKKISSSKDEKCKDVEEMRKPKAFSVGSKDQLKSISKKKETSEIDSVSDGKHLRRKKSLHQMRKHGCSDSEGRSDIDTSAVLWDIDLEEQKRMLEAIKSGTNFGMSMYDRVKRRSQRPDEERKKSQALEQLREKKTKKKKELNRVCLSSSSDSDESKKDYNKQSPPVIQDIQHIKKEIEGNQNHSEVDENEEQDSFETKITKQQDSNKEECRKPEIVSSPIKRPQIAPKKPAIMERIEKEGWGDGAFESKYSSSSDEWSVSVSADEKTDNEEPGRIGDKIVQKKLASLIETTKECHQQLDAKRLGSSSSTSSLSSSSSSSDTSDDDVRVPPKGIPIFKKHVPKKTAKISMVDVFGEDSDNQEELEKEKSTVKQQQLDHHSKAEKVQKNNNEEPENKKKSTALANIKQHPVGLKKESIKLNKNEAISAQKKVIERKRKPSERESLISTKKKLDKKEIKEALNENQASKLQNHPSKLHEQINDSKEKSSESQMVVIAAGFIEIDSKVLKGQQGDKTSLSDQNSQQMDNTQICDKQISTQENQKSSDKIQPLDQQLQKNTSDIGNLLKENADQEELDAIASINNPARLNDDDKLPKNDFIFVEKSSNERKRKSSETETFSISTKKKCDKKEEIQKTANENREPKLENPLNKVSVSDSKLASFTPHSVSERILESKEKPSESQMVVIATGFVEIDANVLKGQQETEKNSLYCHSDSSQHSKAQSTLSHNASDNERVNDSKEKVIYFIYLKQFSSTLQEQKSDIIQTLEQQLLISNTQQHENSADQEELDAIASINNPPVRLNDECDKLLKNDSIVIEKRFIERKRKPSEDESFSTSTQNKFNKNEGIQKTHESQEPQVQKSSDKVCDLQSETKLAQSFLSHNAPERVNDSKEKPSESQMVVIATGFVEIDAELLKEQQENETASMQHHSNKGPDQMVTTQVCVEKHFSSQQNQNTLEKAFETVQTLDQQHQFHFVDSKNTFYGDFYGDSSAKQETLGAIASIKHPARLNNECANIEKEMNVAAESFSKSTQNFIKQENAQITQHQNQETMRYSQNVYEMNKEKQVPDSDMVNATNVPINTPSKWNSLFNTPTSSSHSALNDQQQRDAVIGLLGGHSNFGIAQSSNTLDELCLQQVADQQQPKQQYTPTSITISNTIQQVPNFSAMMTAASNPLSSASLSKWNPLFKTPSSSTVSGQNDQQQMNAVIGLLGGHSRFGMANASVASNTLDELCRQQFITSQQQQPQQQYIPLSNPVQSFEIKQQQQDETQKLRHHTISLPTQPIHNTHFPLNVSTSQNLQFNKLTIQKPSTINQPLHQQSTAQRTAIFQQSPSDHPTQLSQNQQKHVQGQQSIPNISAMMTAASNTLSTAALSNTLNTAALSKWNPLFKTPSSSTVSGQNDQQQINAVIGLLGGHSRFGLANASVASNTLDELCRQQFITGQQQPQQQYAPVQSFEIKQQQDKTQQQRHLISLASEPIHNAQFPMTVSSAQNQQVNQAIQKPILNYQKPQIQQQQQINIPSHRTPVVQQLPAVHPPQISQTHQQKIVQRQQSTQGGYPIIWQGQLAMKNADTLVQMHKVCGNEQLIERMNRELVTLNEQSIPLLRVTQRMRLEQSQLDSLMRKMEREENHVALICLPCGRDRNDVSIQTEKMATSFIEYYSSKSAAGIVSSVTFNKTKHHPQGCVAHIFPPSELSRALLSKNAPEILKKVDFLGAGYLFVILTNS
uniref:SPOC domain-containing protein n=1 Tax=Meloidogyne hapla TaxID=6305 RepID=A0A1I8BE01_MELHA